MKLFIHGFWDGFINKSNPLHIEFFINLLCKVFCEEIELSDFENSDILLESIFSDKTFLYDKKWKYSFLFSGESRLNNHHKDYSCVLYGERNHDNIINVPLFIPYIYCNNLIEQLSSNGFDKENNKEINIPEKDVCVIITNPCGNVRNEFLNELEKHIKIDYAGGYKTNVEQIREPYNTKEFADKVSNYKFIVSMENSQGDTYITEKIIHGFVSGIIPIYWGSKRIHDYFNDKRFIQLKSMDSVQDTINEIKELCNDTEKYIAKIRENIFKNKELYRTIDVIADDIKNLLFDKPFKKLDKIYAICSELFEPVRYNRLLDMFNCLKCETHNVKFICPTFKQTITDEIMQKHVKHNLIKNIRRFGMRKSEISLFLNYKAVLEDIEMNYLDGNFLILESDVFALENMKNFNDFIECVNKLRDDWDMVHIGIGGEEQIFGLPYCNVELPYREKPLFCFPNQFIEDIFDAENKYRFVRKLHTRCTDSLLWNYKGVIKFLDCLTNNYYDAPFDYFLINFLENNHCFKHYWSVDTFFAQGSNMGLDSSTIQTDQYGWD